MTPPLSQIVAHTPPLSTRIEERIVGPCRVLIGNIPVQDVVSWYGSLVSHPDSAAGERLVQACTVRMLDKGTLDRDRFALAEVLDNRGAQIQFSSNALRVSFQGRALRDDVPDVLNIMAEELRRPLFDGDEFEKVRAQYQAALQRSLTNTATQAAAALAGRLYGLTHPNYRPPTQEALEQLEALTVEHVRAYHARHFGARELLLVFIGDVDPDAVEQAVRGAFGDWPDHETAPTFTSTASPQAIGRSSVFMPEKHNIDVQMGHALPIRRSDPDYLPLYLAAYVLGGNFSARLMTRVRDEMGLTYGIHAGLSGISSAYEGHWGVGVTLSQGRLDAGIEATLDEVRRFVVEGPTLEEIRDKQTTITGAYKVGLATTSGLASTLYQHALWGFDLGYVDRFTEEVAAVTRSQVQDVIRRHLHPDALQVALAGTLP